MSHLYVPSGKYPPYAPIIFMLVLFVSTGICGFFYGYFFSVFVMFMNHGVQGVDPFNSLLALLGIGGILMVTVVVSIRILKVRNPTQVRRWVWYASVAGWFLNWLVGIYIASGSGLSFFHFIVDGLLNGIPGIITHRSDLLAPIWINWYVLLLGILFEILFIPLFIGHFAFAQAFMLFSEKKMDWYKQPIQLPFCICKHPTLKKMVTKRLDIDDDWVETSSLNLRWNILGFSIFLFFPKDPQDNIYFSPLYRPIHIPYGIPSIPCALPNSFWLVTEEQVEMLIKKFDPNRITRATELLDKYRYGNKLGKVRIDKSSYQCCYYL